jgi:hypothetical protein
MSSGTRHNWGLVIDVLDVLEQHGYHQSDDRHTGRAVGIIGDLARIYDGTQEAPGAYTVSALRSPQPGDELRTPVATTSAEAIAGARMHTILAALGDASGYERDRAECCADCGDQSCGTCQHRLDAARSYEGLSVRLMRAMESATARKQPQPADAVPGRRAEAAADREAGQ